MTRAKATALVLVNWRGVFYERYLLDANVTALEGANGAGKTTVMIAAYVALFPDLGRLRFTNVGESGATGGDKGLWGRLGSSGRPSYAVLQVRLGDELFLLGVHLERKTEPTLELTPFLVRQVPSDLTLSSLLLRQVAEHDEVPTLNELKQAASELGTPLQVFSSAKDYFAKLFELGLSPLRLSVDEERNKFNDMLRTSMTGGISRTLTSELRWFVFRQDTGLSDTLGRMRSSLSACRRTRTEVSEARRLEHEVSSIYDAALSMFAAGFFSTKRRAQELFELVTEARQQREHAQEAARKSSLEAEALNTELQSLAARLEHAETERVGARDAIARLERALAAGARLETIGAELTTAQTNHERALDAQRQASLRRSQLQNEQKSLQEALARSAAGLAHLQSGLDELHRKAHAHRVYRLSLQRVRDNLNLSLDPEDDHRDELELALNDLEKKLAELDSEAARRQRETQALETRRREYTTGKAALEQIEGELSIPPAGDGVYHRARGVLAALQRLELDVIQLPSLQARKNGAQASLAQRKHLLSELERIGWSPSTAHELVTISAQAEARLLELERDLRTAEWELQRSQRNARDLERELLALREQQAEYERLLKIEARISDGPPLKQDRETLYVHRTRLESELAARRLEVAAAEQRRDAAKREAIALESNAGGIDVELIALADELEGELLVRRYEEVAPALAPSLEAQLGPLLDAIVVEDLQQAISAVERVNPSLLDVWLVEAGSPGLPSPEMAMADSSSSTHVAVSTPNGARVSRIRQAPHLGRKARERRLALLRKTEAQAERAVVEGGTEVESLQEQLRDLGELVVNATLWLRGSRQDELEQQETALAACRTQLLDAQARVEQLPTELAQLKQQLATVRPLLPHASLLDEDHQLVLEQLLAETARLTEHSQLLERVSSQQATLASHLEILRESPPSAEEVRTWSAERQAREEERDHLYGLATAIRDLIKQSAARAWRDAERLLSEQGALAPALEEEHAKCVRALTHAEQQLHATEAHWEQSTALAQKAGAEVVALEAHLARTRLELSAEGFGAGAPGGEQERLHEARDAADALDRASAQLRRDAQTYAANAARMDERRQAAEAEVRSASQRLQDLEAKQHPAQAAWEAVTAEAASEGVLALVKRADLEETFSRLDSDGLRQRAEQELSLLQERLSRSSSGQRVTQELSTIVNDTQMRPFLPAWKLVRAWLAERVPARIVESGDPLQSLSKLRDELHRLEQRLLTQETELRGESRDVARNIEVQIRKATNQVRRLNQHLSRVSFGTISAIRVRLERVERMAKILQALHEGAAQSLLFQSAMPIEEAMDEIFRRYGGGRGGGQRLLDYREYLELNVEVCRRHSDVWERANPSRLSTGEAIGVGAALMMVILTEWERDANLLRAQKTLGTLRFLFLDEANRLSRDNLAVLFELCETLELQLLIAAPEVAHVEHNTTYRLVRQVDELGHEEVVVTGRRARKVALPFEPDDA